jgi:DUF4097 and DUF4098 domain-containing protein YvlB
MNRQCATWSGAILGMVAALAFTVLAHAESRRFTEEFHHTYSLAAGGRIELDNINGAVHITAWDRNEVKVDAVKYAGTRERLDEAQIRVNAGNDYVSIRTEYRDRNLTFSDDDSIHNPASVEYTLVVPRSARLDRIKLTNGSLDISGTSGEVRAGCVNGELAAHGISGPARLSTVNGRLNAEFANLSSPLELSSVNGNVELRMPSDSNAEIEASTVNGGIDDNFGLHVRKHKYVGKDVHAELGGGGTRIKLSNVNGRIEIRHLEDQRSISPVRDLDHEHDRDGDDDDAELD